MNKQIKDFIEKHNLKQTKGNVFSGLCPFHEEKTPSFTLHVVTGEYYCFGCGAEGNVTNSNSMKPKQKQSFNNYIETKEDLLYYLALSMTLIYPRAMYDKKNQLDNTTIAESYTKDCDKIPEPSRIGTIAIEVLKLSLKIPKQKLTTGKIFEELKNHKDYDILCECLLTPIPIKESPDYLNYLLEQISELRLPEVQPWQNKQ